MKSHEKIIDHINVLPVIDRYFIWSLIINKQIIGKYIAQAQMTDGKFLCNISDLLLNVTAKQVSGAADGIAEVRKMATGRDSSFFQRIQFQGDTVFFNDVFGFFFFRFFRPLMPEKREGRGAFVYNLLTGTNFVLLLLPGIRGQVEQLFKCGIVGLIAVETGGQSNIKQ